MGSSKLLLVLGLAMSWGMSSADTGGAAFKWQFQENFSSGVSQCKSYVVQVLPLPSNASSFGVPPYYMIAWKAGGIPTVSPIGSDRNNLLWTANQASGSNLILTVADSQGNSGGEASSVFSVSGSNSTCLPPAPSTNITLIANVSTSDNLETCEGLGLRVVGGQKPYTVSIAAINSAVVTNVTFGDEDDVMTWPNQADPNGQLLVSVSDANGVWGTSPGIFKTVGAAVTNETNCNFYTSTNTAANVDQHPAQPSKSHTAVIVAVIVPIVVVALLVGLAFFLWRRRKHQEREPEPAFLPDAWTGPSIVETGTEGATTFSPYDPPPSSKMARYRDELGDSSRTSSSQPGIGMGYLSPGISGAPRRSGTMDGYSGPESVNSGSRTGSYVGGKGDPRLPPGVSSEWTVEPDIIIQHRDGGAVQEIPPPYLDHSAQLSSSGAAAAASTSLNIPESADANRPSNPREISSLSTGSSNSTTPLNSGSRLDKGKGKDTGLIE